MTVTGENHKKFLAGAFCLFVVLAALAPRFLTVFPVIVPIIFALVYRREKKCWPSVSLRDFLAPTALCFLMATSSLWAIDPAMTFEKTLKTAPMLFGAAFLFVFSRVDNGEYFHRWFPFAALAAFLLCVLELYTGGKIYYLFHAPPAPGTEGNLFYLNRSSGAMVLIFFAALSCVRLSAWKKELKIALSLIFTLCIAAILYRTDSQSAQLAFCVAASFYLLFPVRIKPLWIIVWGVLAGGIFAAPWIAQEIFHPMVEVAKETPILQRGYAPNRLEMWDMVAKRALERPILGHGIEATKAIKDFPPAEHNISNEFLHPHNFALQLWIELGILGPLFAAIFFGAILRAASRMEAIPARTALAILFASVMIVTTGYGLWQGMWVAVFGSMFSLHVLSASRKTPQ